MNKEEANHIVPKPCPFCARGFTLHAGGWYIEHKHECFLKRNEYTREWLCHAQKINKWNQRDKPQQGKKEPTQEKEKHVYSTTFITSFLCSIGWHELRWHLDQCDGGPMANHFEAKPPNYGICVYCGFSTKKGEKEERQG